MSPIVKRRVFIIAAGYKKIEGELSVPEGVRVSDFLNKAGVGPFLSVSNVKIYNEDGSFEETPFVAVNKEHIVYVKENT